MDNRDYDALVVSTHERIAKMFPWARWHQAQYIRFRVDSYLNPPCMFCGSHGNIHEVRITNEDLSTELRVCTCMDQEACRLREAVRGEVCENQ